MKFFAIHLEDLESELFVTASNDQIATWLFLHAFCCKQFNRGVITNTSGLGDRFWSRHGIDNDILKSPSPLWSWDGSSITVQPYDIEGQIIYESKAKGGKKGADKRWNRTPNRTPNAPDQTRPNQTVSNQTLPNPSSSVNDEENPSPKGGDLHQKNNSQELVNTIWKNTPPKGRERSSKKQLEAALKKISAKDAPLHAEIIAGLEAWKVSELWIKDEGQYVAGIHRWVNDRKWESPPEPVKTKQSATINTGRRPATIEEE